MALKEKFHDAEEKIKKEFDHIKEECPIHKEAEKIKEHHEEKKEEKAKK